MRALELPLPRPPRRTASQGLWWVVGALAFPWGAVAAQGSLLEGRMEVRLPSPGSLVPVAMEYRLLPDTGVREVGLTLLSPGGTRVIAPKASWAEGPLPLKLLELRPYYWSGTVTLPPGGGPLSLRITYDVAGGWEESGRVTVPILAAAWVPEDPHPRTFVARVDVPAGVTLTESFPTSVEVRPRGSEGGPYEMALQGVPAMLVLRTVQGDPPFLTLEGILDALVVAALLIMAAVGIRFLRGGGG